MHTFNQTLHGTRTILHRIYSSLSPVCLACQMQLKQPKQHSMHSCSAPIPPKTYNPIVQSRYHQHHIHSKKMETFIIIYLCNVHTHAIARNCATFICSSMEIPRFMHQITTKKFLRIQ